MNDRGLGIFFRDTSPTAGHRYGYTFDSVLRAIGTATLIDVEPEIKLPLCRNGIASATSYLNEDGIAIPFDFEPPALRQSEEGLEEGIVYLLGNNARQVLQNLNANAKHFLHRAFENRGYHFAGTYGKLYTTLKERMEKRHSRESRMRSYVDAFQNAFDYAVFTAGGKADMFECIDSEHAEESLARMDARTRENLSRMFNGYRKGSKEHSRTYEPVREVESFCAGKEPVILYLTGQKPLDTRSLLV